MAYRENLQAEDRTQERLELMDLMGAANLTSLFSTPPPPFLFENCFRDHSITVITAPAGTGKTTLMLDMAFCLEHNLPLLGRFKPAGGRNLFFLGCDSPSWDYANLLKKLLVGHQIDPKIWHLIDIPGIWHRGPKITDPELRVRLSDWKKVTGANVLFIDSHRSTHSADENDSTEMTQVWDILRTLCDSGWAIVMAHHSGKNSAVRGTTVINDSADFIYELNRFGETVAINCLKGRAGRELDAFNGFEVLESGNGIRLQRRLSDQILDVLGSTGGKTRTELLGLPYFVGMDKDKAYKKLDNTVQHLNKKGQIISQVRGIWTVAP